MNMIRIKKGEVLKIIDQDEYVTYINVLHENMVQIAVNYNYLSGSVKLNDIVYVNTTANFLKLGSGGYDFVIINETRGQDINLEDPGHIMKLKYTPFQIKCNCPEEMDTYYDKINSFKTLENMPVITGELHSMLSATACCLKYLDNKVKIVYIMTDGGSLPMYFSNSVKELSQKDVIYSTISCGNAFGGDFEAINIYDALVIAKSILKCDIAIVLMGPGIVGTNTKYGFSGVEQGFIIDCINNMKGTPVFIPRISFYDARYRHFGISHHTITILTEIATTRANVVIPIIDNIENANYIKSQISASGIDKKHTINLVDGSLVCKALELFNINPYTMGRNINEDKDFFLSCGACAYFTYTILNNNI